MYSLFDFCTNRPPPLDLITFFVKRIYIYIYLSTYHIYIYIYVYMMKSSIFRLKVFLGSCHAQYEIKSHLTTKEFCLWRESAWTFVHKRLKRIKWVEDENDSRAAQVGEGGIRSKSRVPIRNEEEEERAGGKRERKESTGGGGMRGELRAVKGEKR